MPPFNTYKLDINTDDIAGKVFKLKDYWISRSDEFHFHTLGRCAYLDAKTPAYKKESKILNPILHYEFDSLYRIIIDHLSYQFKERIYLRHDLAHPSFHIFESSKRLLTHSGLWHRDNPHTLLGLDTIDPYTFTIAIKLPTGGGGMDYLEDNVPKYYPYTEKEFVGHDGSVLHRMSSLKQYVPDEFRITLQGHLIRINGSLSLFW